nr:PREDICTED: uncharacterized protein LOC109044745 [Bemisia tabaci]
MEYMGLSPVPPQINPHLPSGSRQNTDIRLEEATRNCWHNCLKQYGYINPPKHYNRGRSELVPITNGKAVVVGGVVSEICDCALSTEVITLLSVFFLDVKEFDRLRQMNNEFLLKLFIRPKGLQYMSYSEVQERLRKSLKKNSVAMDVRTASRRHRDSPC